MVLVCADCGHENKDGQLFCARCGAELSSNGHTPIISAEELVERVKNHQRLREGLGLYGAPGSVTLRFEDGHALRVVLKRETTLGRRGPRYKPAPDVDLSPYDARAKGVSRVHAVIQNLGNVLTLTDLGSTNGTTLNGERLNPDKPRIIKANDEIGFGRLKVRIEFDD